MIIRDSKMKYCFEQTIDTYIYSPRSLDDIPLIFDIWKKNYGNLYEVTTSLPECQKCGNKINIATFINLDLKK